MTTEISPNAIVKLEGSGNGQVSLGPPSGAAWRLRLATVSTTSTVNQPKCFLYRGSTSGPAELIDSTYLGNSASSGLVAGAPFFAGQVLWARWTGGDAGAVATLQVYGQQGLRGDIPFDEGGAITPGFPLTVATVFQAGNTIINPGGNFVYSSAPALGDLIAAIVAAAGPDQFGNQVPAPGFTAFGATVNQWANLDNAVLSFNAAAGQASQAGIASNAAGQMILESGQVTGGDTQAEVALLSAQANAGTALIELLANALVQGNLQVTGTLTVNGSTSTGNGSNGGVTSGPSGTVSSFPAAGPNHTHAEIHTHPL